MFSGEVQVLDDSAIEFAIDAIGSARVFGQWFFGFFEQTDQTLMRLTDQRDVCAVEQVQANTQIDDGPDDGGGLHFLPRWVRVISHLPGEVVGALGVVFPEIDAFAQPVVVVGAGCGLILARDDIVGKFLVAAVVPQNE